MTTLGKITKTPPSLPFFKSLLVCINIVGGTWVYNDTYPIGHFPSHLLSPKQSVPILYSGWIDWLKGLNGWIFIKLDSNNASSLKPSEQDTMMWVRDSSMGCGWVILDCGDVQVEVHMSRNDMWHIAKALTFTQYYAKFTKELHNRKNPSLQGGFFSNVYSARMNFTTEYYTTR